MTVGTSKKLLGLWGPWYCDYIYFKYNLYALPASLRVAVRLLLLPAALFVKAKQRLRRQFEIPRIEMPITTQCNLRCKDCCNLIPFYKKPANIPVSQIISDIDDFMSNVDRVYRFVVMGGEIFLHPDLRTVLSHLLQDSRIGLVNLVTNATIIPDEEMLALMQNKRVYVTISNYPDEVARNKSQFIAALGKRKISFACRDMMWVDRGGLDPAVDNSPAALMDRFANCSNRFCHNLINGEYHLCPRSGHGQQLGQFTKIQADSVLFRGRHNPRQVQNELRRLLQKEYITACTKCNGDYGETIDPAIQMNRKSHPQQ